jgi:hypothetical protein
MERVAFIIEASGERVGCLLNPETFEVRRRAGVALVPEDASRLAGRRRRDDPIFFTGGGITELELSLLFDVQLETAAQAVQPDVRLHSGPLVALAEGSTDGWATPPLVRFVWGKAWNVLGVVVAVSERLERFTTDGVPQRSWLRLRFRRVEEDVTPAAAEEGPPPPVLTGLADRPQAEVPPPGPAEREVVFQRGDRLDDLAARTYGDPRLWRWIAWVNGLVDPLRVPPGTVLRLPPPELPEATA